MLNECCQAFRFVMLAVFFFVCIDSTEQNLRIFCSCSSHRPKTERLLHSNDSGIHNARDKHAHNFLIFFSFLLVVGSRSLARSNFSHTLSLCCRFTIECETPTISCLPIYARVQAKNPRKLR